jgi:hypothetical protein
LLNDTFVVQPPGLCTSVNNTLQEVPHSARPASVPGVQAVAVAAGKQWCAANGSIELEVDGQGPLSADHVDAVTSASDNSSYSAIRVTTDNLGIFANTTGARQDVAGSALHQHTRRRALLWLCAHRVVVRMGCSTPFAQ